MRLVVLDAETLGLPAAAWEPFAELGDWVAYDFTPRDEAEIVRRCTGAAIVLSNKVPLTRKVLEQLPGLRLIAVLATGMNNIDLAAAADLGISVRNVPDYSTPAVVQHTVALVMELTNRVGYYAASVANGRWERSRQFCYWDHDIPELAGRTLGIVGFGQIGRAVGQVFQAMGMRVVAHTRTPRDAPPWHGFAFRSLEDLFAEADIVSLHCPLTEDNHGFVNAALLARMRTDAILVNTARGPLIVEEDLAAALRAGRPAAAALDVLASEPMQADHPLRHIRNCLITPHIAWASREARLRLLQCTLDHVHEFIASS